MVGLTNPGRTSCSSATDCSQKLLNLDGSKFTPGPWFTTTVTTATNEFYGKMAANGNIDFTLQNNKAYFACRWRCDSGKISCTDADPWLSVLLGQNESVFLIYNKALSCIFLLVALTPTLCTDMVHLQGRNYGVYATGNFFPSDVDVECPKYGGVPIKMVDEAQYNAMLVMRRMYKCQVEIEEGFISFHFFFLN